MAASSDDSEDARRDLEGVLALAGAVARAGDGSVEEFLRELEAGEEGPGPADPSAGADLDSVRVLTAHGIAGLEFDIVVVIGAVEGNFPSLSRPEPMFDLSMLERRASQADRNRERLEDERRLLTWSRAGPDDAFCSSRAIPEEKRAGSPPARDSLPSSVWNGAQRRGRPAPIPSRWRRRLPCGGDRSLSSRQPPPLGSLHSPDSWRSG